MEVDQSAAQKALDLPELCASFMIAVADQDDTELLTFQDETAVLDPDGRKAMGVLSLAIALQLCVRACCFCVSLQLRAAELAGARPVVFELYGDGIHSSEAGSRGIEWGFVTRDQEALKELRIISTASFRHVYTNPETVSNFNRLECFERCRILTSIDMPFPHEMLSKNVDLLANMLMLGLVPVDAPEDLVQCLESRSLTRGVITKEQMVQFVSEWGLL